MSSNIDFSIVLILDNIPIVLIKSLRGIHARITDKYNIKEQT